MMEYKKFTDLNERGSIELLNAEAAEGWRVVGGPFQPNPMHKPYMFNILLEREVVEAKKPGRKPKKKE